MPNWCHNTVTVRGPEHTLENLLTKLGKDDEGHLQILESLWPMPQALVGTTAPGKPDPNDPIQQELTARYGAVNWYDWACSHRGWGTKWGDCRTELVEQRPGELVFTCDTAWSPPISGFINLSREWGELAFCLEYYEIGMAFAGETMIQNGQVVAHKERELEMELYDETEHDEETDHGETRDGDPATTPSGSEDSTVF